MPSSPFLFALALRDVGVPAELKFLTFFALGVVASFGLGWQSAGSQLVGRIL
jgi:hypothetical protein